MRKVVVVMRDHMGAQTEQLTALRLLLIEVMLKKMIPEAIIRVMMKTMLVGEEIGIVLTQKYSVQLLHKDALKSLFF